MRVDVVVPCHNAAPFVAEAIDSALKQTYADVHVIVVDDGSTDATAQIARGFGPRVTVLVQQNAGPAAARNRALDVAAGEYVAFLDADDRWHPDKVARQVAFLRNHRDCGLVHTAIRHIDAAGSVTGRPLNAPRRRLTTGDCQLRLSAANTITTSSVLVRRELLARERFFPPLVGPEDWDLWLRLAAAASFGYVDQELTDYRVHETNLVRGRQRMLTAELLVLDRVAARFPEREVVRAVRSRRRHVFAALGHLAYAEGNAAGARECFRCAGVALGRDGVIEYLAVLLPAGVRQPARRCWRRLRGAAA